MLQLLISFIMADPLGGDIFDNEALAEAEIEKLVKQVGIRF